MNNLVKKAAVKKYAPLLATLSEPEIKIEISEDQKDFTEDEINEIFEAITSAEGDKQQPANDEKPATLNVLYEEWKVKPIKEPVRQNDGSMRNEVVDYEKDAQKPIRTTSITPDKANELNSQSENTLVRLYEVA